MANHKMVTLTHPAIEAWDWPAMTMEFSVASDIDMMIFVQGERLDVELREGDDSGYQVSKIITEAKPAPSVVVKVMVESVMANHKMVTLTHPAIEAWDWPAMTMEFSVASDIDMGLFVKGQSLEVELREGTDSGYQVSRVIVAAMTDHSSMNHASE